MSPVLSDLNENALKPYLDDKISQDEAFDEASGTMKEFMSKYTRQEDLQLFLKYGNYEQPETLDDVPLLALVPAYAISELKTAFQIGFMIFLPFLILLSCSSNVLGNLHAQMATNAMNTPDHNTALMLPVKYHVNANVVDITNTIAYLPFCGNTLFCVQFVRNLPNHG